MTARECWEGLLTELSKVNAPSMLLEDFNYFFNKAINQYINKHYNTYDVNQQSTDDLRVLKSTAILDPKKVTEEQTYKDIDDWGAGDSKFLAGTYYVNLPLDYVHLLNCICIYKLNKSYKCYDKNNYVQFAAKRLTSDAWSVVINDYYNRPLPQRPYYYIHNVNTSAELPTNPFTPNKETILTKDAKGTDPSTSNKLPRIIQFENTTKNLVDKEEGIRYGNTLPIRMEIRYGNDDSVFTLTKVMVDYLKAPQTIRLTQEQVNLTSDTSQIMEFPDYVCQEIINELVMLVMENTADPRLQTNIAVTKSIANPAQQQAQSQIQ